ncbi:MAG: glucose-6-phosphate isomerase [Balneola sp.]|nr:glucose-6-phosphate isomerase [Balneola sp.]|tara:strand:+ start:3086 stop:4369 length:1284 start_codon:yes stop_codon:yes gene_type:complete
MIKANISRARKFLTDQEYIHAHSLATKGLDDLRHRTGPGSAWLGWRDLLEKPDSDLVAQLNQLGKKIHDSVDVFIVCGIGGSYLGAKAVIDALKPPFTPNGPEILFAGYHMSGAYLKDLLQYLKMPKADGSKKSIVLNVISKSGSTLETALSFRVLRKFIHEEFEDAVERIICTTSERGGVLNEVIDKEGYQKFIIPSDVGGRFSVLTPVGLLPIAVAGISIEELFEGAVSNYKILEENADVVVEYAALRNALHSKGITIDIFTSFEPELLSFGRWIQQLLGESEGKDGKGIFPTVAGFSTDLHSLGQFIQDGTRSLFETFLVVDQVGAQLSVPSSLDFGDGLDYLEGDFFHSINSKAESGTIEAHCEGQVPIVTIHLSELNAKSVGALIYFYQIFTGVFVYSLGINPFNQPGVEDYKKAMYRLLGK